MENKPGQQKKKPLCGDFSHLTLAQYDFVVLIVILLNPIQPINT